ncbi:multidrug resistance-associated protein 7 [Tetranychus urticae]|uniref:ABC-type xenobiotic transporter n=1 Tax=Tetranychus urticae TaxID=32264 RepID=T1K0H8_TETUR|nr:multidrug resistance-associated protein 7 [Tetranychus urticae]
MDEPTLYEKFCGEPQFNVFTGYSLDYCFLQMIIEIPLHFFIALVSTLLLSTLTIPDHVYIKQNWPKWVAHGFRLILTLTVINLILLEYWSLPDGKHPPDIAIISIGIKIIAWFMVSLVSYRIIKFSPLTKLVNLSSLMVLMFSALISNGLHLDWVLNNRTLSSSYSQYTTIIASLVIAINLIFILTLWPRFNRWRIFKEQLYDTDLQNLLSQSHPMSTSFSASFSLDNHQTCSLPSRFFFYWVNPLLTKGYKQKIKSHNDLFPLPSSLSTNTSYERLIQHIVPNESGLNHPYNKFSLVLWKSLFKAFGRPAFITAFFKIVADIFYFGGPLILERLILYIEDETSTPSNEGFYYCAFLLGSTLVSSISISLYNFQSANISLKITSSISKLLYRKLLNVRSDSMASTFSSGEIINFLSTDTGRVTNFYPSMVAFLTLPLQLVVTLYLLYSQLGLAFLAGLLLTLIIIPVNKVICDKIGSLNVHLLKWKDKRIKLMSEMLTGIRLVKMQAWENVFEAEIIKLRNEEMKYMRKIKYLDALCVYFWATTPVLISLSTFATYVLLGNHLTASRVFTSLALFNMLINPLNALPWVLNGLIEACISAKRIQKFLDIKEMNLSTHYTGCLKGETKLNSVGSFFKRDTITLDHRFTLGPIDLIVKSGDYVGIAGSVGSGKSSLFSAIIGEMSRASGTFQINDHDLIKGIGYVPQDPWIQNTSIRENILFGSIFDPIKYKSVIDACALVEDFKIFPNGDATIVGDRGVTLSGGQKARIALARAVYQDFDIYLLDDPYSSVDAHVADHIKTKCIDGLLSSKTKLLSTHHTEYLTNAQLIVVMDNGLMMEKGNSGILAYVKPKDTVASVPDKKEFSESVERVEKPSEEAMEKGTVKFDIYRHYWKSVGPWLSPFILILFTFMQISRTASDWWLSHWTTAIKNSTSSLSGADTYLGVFAGISIINSLFSLFRAFFFAYGGIAASKAIHSILLKSTLTSTISFFDTTAFGRIINRFSSDITNVDDGLPFNLNILLSQIFGLAASLFITIYGIPWTAFAVLPLFIPYFFIQKYYRWTSRDMKRLCAVSLSPVYHQLAETIQGVSTIRAFAATSRFITDFVDKIDVSNTCQYAFSAASQWLNIRLQVLGVIFSCAVALTAVILHYFALVEVNAGLVGLALAYSLTITGLLNGFVQTFSQVEVDMISVERIQQFVRSIGKEDDDGHRPEHWPNKGEIIFEQVSLRYKPESPLALNQITITIEPRQHIGIIGRTGSGKSTLLQTLFRLKDLENGRIIIDGVDISTVNVRHLRSSLFIVPQDSYLFSGSIRHNLDPLHRHTDDEIWKALRQCQADSLVLSLGSLNAIISENGRDLSFGQRQLICLTRALLSRAKIICFDEITSSIDRETDQVLEKTIRSSFKHSTILTVAHKIETVLYCDRVLLMEGGRIIEDGNPQKLKMNTSSKFYKLWSAMNAK